MYVTYFYNNICKDLRSQITQLHVHFILANKLRMTVVNSRNMFCAVNKQFCLNSKYYIFDCTENTARIIRIKKRMKLNSHYKLHLYPSSFLFLVAKLALLVVYCFTKCHVPILIQCCNCEEYLTYENCYYCYCADNNYSFRLHNN